MQSIRSFLFVNLIFSIVIVMAIALVGNLSFSHKVFKEGLDVRLASHALFIDALLDKETPNSNNDSVRRLQNEIYSVPTQLKRLFPNVDLKKDFFQIHDDQANLLLASNNQPLPISMIKNPGFQDILLDGVLWRAFNYSSQDNKWIITAMQRYDVYDIMEKHLIQDSVFITLVIVPFLSILIMTIVNQGLDNIKEVIDAVKNRAVTNLKPVDIKKVPSEIKPLVTELNGLFKKLQEYLDREKRFAADAAHELRTPLAALKIQAQVALNTNDENELKAALRNIIKGADRSTYTVSQLLALSRTIPEAYNNKNESVSFIKEAQQAVIDLIHAAKQKNIDIELIAPEKITLFCGNPITIGILIKNLVDNDIRYTQNNGQVQIVLDETDNNIILKVIVTGPGIPPELRTKVFDRFFRIIGSKEPGSGLGLSIVKQIADLYKATIDLKTPASGIGLEIAVTFPKTAQTTFI